MTAFSTICEYSTGEQLELLASGDAPVEVIKKVLDLPIGTVGGFGESALVVACQKVLRDRRAGERSGYIGIESLVLDRPYEEYRPFIAGKAIRKARRLGRVPLIAEELVGVGNLALAECIDRYDPSKGDFHPFAGIRIAGSKIDFERSFYKQTVGLSRERAGVKRLIELHYSHLAQVLGREPTDSDVVHDLGVFDRTVLDLALSINGAGSDPTSEIVLDGIEIDEIYGIAREVARERSQARYTKKIDPERLVGMIPGAFAQNEIASELGVSPEAVSSQIQSLGARVRNRLEF